MSFMDKIRDGASKIQENMKARREEKEKKIALLSRIRMRYLKELQKEYNAVISWNEMSYDTPSEKDYARSLADYVPLNRVEEFVKEVEKRQKDVTNPKGTTNISIQQLKMEKSSLTGNVVNDSVFNDFSSKILNSTLDFNIITEASRKLEELKHEVNRKQKDTNRIKEISQWFTNHKSELATISIPFISKILSMI